MSRSALTSFCLALALAAGPVAAFAQAPAATAAAPAGVTAAEAGPFLGDWTITGQSDMGPFVIALSMAVEEESVVGTMSSEIQAATKITDVTKSGDNLVLRYYFDYEGNAVPAMVTLAPKADKLDATFSFAEGAFVMSGVGAKTAQ